MEFERRCWAEIDLDILKKNYNTIAKLANGTPVMAVVKADAYGHGDKETAVALDRAGAAAFAVSNIQEAVLLRMAGILKPILILGYTPAVHAKELAKYHITQAVFSTEYAAALSEEAYKAKVSVDIHIKVDTGMGRIGFCALNGTEAAAAEITAVCKMSALNPTGIFMHFAVADEISAQSVEYTDKQYRLFCDVIDACRKKGVEFEVKHCCNSAGILTHPERHMDMVRAGIILYGCPPSDEVGSPKLHPVLSLKSTVSMVKQLKPGQSISYGCTYTAREDMLVATVCCGYADGYPRALSNRGICSINGLPAPVVGRVCMDQMLINVTHIPGVKPGDTVTVFGKRPADTVNSVARKADTINYEIMCHLSRRVPRVYLSDDSVVSVSDYLFDQTRLNNEFAKFI